MIHQSLPKISFTSGELTPWLYGRTDVDLVSRGAACINNMVVSPFGGVERRYGTEWVGDTSKAGKIRLMTFAFSSGDQFVLEVGPEYIRYYKDGKVIRNPNGTSYTTKTPWVTEEMVTTLRMQQLNDEIYFVCPHVYPHLLERHADNDWRLSKLTFRDAPVVSVLHNPVKMTYVSDESVPGSIIRADVDADVFDKSMEGTETLCLNIDVDERTYDSYAPDPPYETNLNKTIYAGYIFCVERAGMRYGYTCIKDFTPANYTGSNNPDSYPNHFYPGFSTLTRISLCSSWSLQSFGTWDGHWVLEKSYEENPDWWGNGWVRVKNMIQNDTKRQNYSITGDETENVCLRLQILSWKPGGNKGNMELKISQSEFRCWLKVLKVGNSRTAWLGLVKNFLPYSLKYGTTHKWSFSAFGVYNGYPSAVDFHQGRLWFAGTSGQPQTIWGSAVDDLDRFYPGTTADAPLTLTLAASQQNRICWIKSLKGLLIGTTEGEWMLYGSDGGIINATNAAFSKQSSIGSAFMDAVAVENSIYYVQQGYGKINEFAYSIESDGFVSNDVSLLSEHILGAGIVEWTAQKTTSPRLWCVLGDGSAACLTINKKQNVMAWQRHRLGDATILSLTSVRTSRDWKEEVWFVTKRGEGSTARHGVERMSENGIYLDAHAVGTSYQGTIFSPFNLIGHHVLIHPLDSPELSEMHLVDENRFLEIREDLKDIKDWVIGIPYSSQITSMPLEDIETLGRIKNQVKSRVLLQESGLTFEYNGRDSGDEWQVYEPSRMVIKSPYSGYIDLTHFTGMNKQPQISIRTSGAEPLNILGIVPEVAVVSG